MVSGKSTGKSVRKVAPKAASSVCPVRIQLELRVITVELRCALSAVTVSAHALCEQNADIDADVAVTLRRAVSSPVHSCVERLEGLLAELECTGSGGGEPETCMH
jgi:hypothetical protein